MPAEEKKIFFSYSRADSEFALKLGKDLRAAGANIWIDQLDIKPGDPWDESIERALHECQKMILILTPESVRSKNVRDEWSYALGNTKTIIPVLLKDSEIPFRLERLQRSDFTESYNDGLKYLLSFLQPEKDFKDSPSKENSSQPSSGRSPEDEEHKREAVRSNPSQSPVSKREESAQTPISKKRGRKKPVLVAGLVVLLLSAAGFGYYWIQIQKERAMWAEVNTNSVASLEEYLAQHPNGGLAEEASKRIKEIRDHQQADGKAWSEASNENTIEAYRNYITQFPAGLHIQEAHNWVDRLEEEATKNRIAEEQRRAEEERLANARGDLIIETRPIGAEVRVGESFIEESPATLTSLKLGSYTIVIRKEGYREKRLDLVVKENETTNPGIIELELITGSISLTSNQFMAAVYKENKHIGYTPLQLKDLRPGLYEYELRLKDYNSQTVQLEVKGDRVLEELVELNLTTGSISLNSTPSKAEVYQENKHIGYTPLQLKDLKPGHYEYELRLEGFFSKTVGLDVIGDQVSEEHVILEKIKRLEEGRDWIVPDLGLEMVWLKPGEFTMGSPPGEIGHADDETQYDVEISKGYWLGKYEVTQGEWESRMGSNPSLFKNDPRLPVETVSWEDAMAFCTKLTERERAAGRLPSHLEYSLPTEAEWEYACRAGTTGPFHYGSSLDSSMANFDGEHPYGDGRKGVYRRTTIEVGSFIKNAWGLYDMHGNVSEWCLDRYGDYPSGNVTDPVGSNSGSYRVLRGGSWNYNAQYCRSACRSNVAQDSRSEYLGFRLAIRSIQPQALEGQAPSAPTNLNVR